MKILIDPMHGLGNCPRIMIYHFDCSKPDYNERLFHNDEDCYWWQGENGLTSFLFHANLSKVKFYSEQNRYITHNNEGFGGRKFSLKLDNGSEIDLIGPWSGGCYVANKWLPKPAIEVTFNNTWAGAMSWEALTLFLPKGFDIVNHDRFQQRPLWPEVRYNGQFKKDWDEETKWRLNENFKEAYNEMQQ